MAENFFAISEDALCHLARKDKKLAQAMEIIGPVKREIRPGALSGLLHAIIGQQISGKAQTAIWTRFLQTFPGLDAQAIADSCLETIQSCGVSKRKADFMQNIARQFALDTFNDEKLAAMNDEELASNLTNLKGIGSWTAEMLQIFTFQRQNILSFGDLGIQRGLRMLYRHREITPALHARYYKRYSPWATTASFYLWEIAGGTYPQWQDPLRKSKKKN